MQADRVRAIWRAGAENAGHGIVRVVARSRLQHAAIRAIEPGEYQQSFTGLQVFESRREFVLHDERGARRAFESLLWRSVSIGERRFDAADGLEFEVRHVCHPFISPGRSAPG